MSSAQLTVRQLDEILFEQRREAAARAAARAAAERDNTPGGMNPVNLFQKFEAAAQAELEQQMNNMDIID
tara:strand:+ start:208 stop:417 length:210 start_codon:yes stop_codon:yes gene_type:complete